MIRCISDAGFQLWIMGVEKEFNYILNDRNLYYKKDSIVFDFDGV